MKFSSSADSIYQIDITIFSLNRLKSTSRYFRLSFLRFFSFFFSFENVSIKSKVSGITTYGATGAVAPGPEGPRPPANRRALTDSLLWHWHARGSSLLSITLLTSSLHIKSIIHISMIYIYDLQYLWFGLCLLFKF